MIIVLLTQPRSFTLQPFRRAWLLETLAVQPCRSRLPSLPLAFSWFKSAAFHQVGPSTNQRAPVKLFLRSHAHLESSLARNQNPPYRCTAYQTFPPFWSSRPMATSGKLDLRSPSTNWKEAKKFLKELDTKKRREHYGIKDYITLKDIPSWKDHAKKLKVQQPEEVKYPKNKDLNQKISITKGDITKLEVDAIVNAGKMHNLLVFRVFLTTMNVIKSFIETEKQYLYECKSGWIHDKCLNKLRQKVQYCPFRHLICYNF
ncbi:Hypothetical predicted protein [Pelobates cultripes]|uniref:Uncharacterized protein n=1 Tax=Pelobates cultripes TaxID=61616 RepID=A0AAD1TFI4_PELCU|nr:Hypothetical predicted protein [Pelobates cultripes]